DALLKRVVNGAMNGNGDKPPPDDVAAMVVKRSN
ncbi:MAG: hypothetical protein QOE26_1266, partial [Verrucomicrobiota bacterium]